MLKYYAVISTSITPSRVYLWNHNEGLLTFITLLIEF